MKKSIKVQILTIILLFGLSPQNQYALDNNDKVIVSSITAGITGLAATKLKLSGCGILTSSLNAYNLVNPDKKTLDIKFNTPHLYKWYNHLVQKYPQAGFDTKPLLIGYNFSADNEKIYIDLFNALEIEKIYTKKITGEKLSQKELQRIFEAEWSLLHEATHINNNDLYSHTLLNIGIIAGLELGYQKYKKSQSVTPTIHSTSWTQSAWKLTKSLPRRAGIFAAMSISFATLSKVHSRYCENRADVGANKHADLDALQGGLSFLQKHSQIEDLNRNKGRKDLPLFLQTHPTTQSRIQKIEDEITRREASK